MSKYESLLSPGVVQPLQLVPFHGCAPFVRRLMAGPEIHPGANMHIAVHEIRDLSNQDRRYCEPHRHTCAEMNLLISFDHLLVRITLDDEVYLQPAPATIFIPPGVLHSANAIEGSGFFIAILPCRDYETTFPEGVLDRGIDRRPAAVHNLALPPGRTGLAS